MEGRCCGSPAGAALLIVWWITLPAEDPVWRTGVSVAVLSHACGLLADGVRIMRARRSDSVAHADR